jgi:hypothetical protein
MVRALKTTGYVIIALGILLSLTAGRVAGAIQIFVWAIAGGVLFLGLSEILATLIKIEKKLPSLETNLESEPEPEPESSQDKESTNSENSDDEESGNYRIVSEDVEVYDADEMYPVFTVKGETYTAAKVFRNYIEKLDDDHYRIHLPGHNEIEAELYPDFVPESVLFRLDSVIYIKLSALGFAATVKNGFCKLTPCENPH